jgi:putative sterol carrier protein
MPDCDSLLAAMRGRATGLRSLGYRIRFDLDDDAGSILLDARPGAFELREADGTEEADTVLMLSPGNLEKLIAGRLSPMLAFATGKLRVEGSKGVAMKLASLLDDE